MNDGWGNQDNFEHVYFFRSEFTYLYECMGGKKEEEREHINFSKFHKVWKFRRGKEETILKGHRILLHKITGFRYSYFHYPRFIGRVTIVRIRVTTNM